MERMCDEVLWLRRGLKADEGDPKRVVDAYLIYVAGGEEALLKSQERAADEANTQAATPAEPGAPDAPGGGPLPRGPLGQPRGGDRVACASSTPAAASVTCSCPGKP